MSLKIGPSLKAQRHVQSTSKKLSKSLEKLASGLRVNSAADDPASLVISEEIRAQVAGLDQAIQNSEVTLSTLQTAEGSLGEISSILINMRQLALHSANEANNSVVTLNTNQEEIQSSLEGIRNISKSTKFASKNLLDGSSGVSGLASGKGLEFLSANEKTKSSAGKGFEVVIQQAPKASFIKGSVSLSDSDVDPGEKLEIQENAKSIQYKITEDDTADDVVNKINTLLRREKINVTAFLTEDDKLLITHNKKGKEHSFQVRSTTSGVLSSNDGEFQDAESGKDVMGRVNDESFQGKGEVLTAYDENKTTSGLVIKYSGDAEIQKRSNEDDDDDDNKQPSSDINGIKVGLIKVEQNSLNFQIGSEPEDHLTVELKNVDPNQLGKNVKNSSGFDSLDSIDVTTVEKARDSLRLIDESIEEISTLRARVGSVQKNVLDSNLTNMKIASENLQAAESTIRDVDVAKEIATYTKNLIQNRLSTSALNQTTSIPRKILKLLDDN